MYKEAGSGANQIAPILWTKKLRSILWPAKKEKSPDKRQGFWLLDKNINRLDSPNKGSLISLSSYEAIPEGRGHHFLGCSVDSGQYLREHGNLRVAGIIDCPVENAHHFSVIRVEEDITPDEADSSVIAVKDAFTLRFRNQAMTRIIKAGTNHLEVYQSRCLERYEAVGRTFGVFATLNIEIDAVKSNPVPLDTLTNMITSEPLS